ncbi:hypothetical protein BDQ12DRAFT_50238 [Crucibulum laeve]|uniref:Uncharacterized protein n=1 Tax=Crucibulum laeve TaxID=68775 RepID=A0A5C3MJR1_9AGAR|nr:hypothetical protein BDQ12DRAFT_50238 [Crucibulum laeve]
MSRSLRVLHTLEYSLRYFVLIGAIYIPSSPLGAIRFLAKMLFQLRFRRQTGPEHAANFPEASFWGAWLYYEHSSIATMRDLQALHFASGSTCAATTESPRGVTPMSRWELSMSRNG